MSKMINQLILYPTEKHQLYKEAESLNILPSQVQRFELLRRYSDKIFLNHELSRSLVSFQANKKIPFYRWFKYKEAFSSELVLYFLDRFHPGPIAIPRALDPFAGAGTTLTAAAKSGWHATGIEILPIAAAAIRARLLADTVKIKSFQYYLKKFEKVSLNSPPSNGYHFPHLRITDKAFPKETERAISSYKAFLDEIKDNEVNYLFWFACLSILEDVSYTRKDGQYLRWDYRSGKCVKSNFSKGIIWDFKTAINRKLQMMLEDIIKRNDGIFSQHVEVIEESCLIELPRLPDSTFNLVITSPPYCNRYDYTRTYALELAFLGYDEEDVKNLRQTLISATVENKTKRDQLELEYRLRNQDDRYRRAVDIFTNQKALHEVLSILNEDRKKGKLNNNNIPNLVENYFFEMNIVINELSRVLAPGGHVVMVNDNVQYNGEEVPVDLILSDFAANAGLLVDHIWVLPRGKGNSSQQMGAYGRSELRKCVYIWSKPS